MRGLGHGGGLLGVTIRLLAGGVECGLGLLHHRISFQGAGHLGQGLDLLGLIFDHLGISRGGGGLGFLIQFLGRAAGAVGIQRGVGVGQRVLLTQLGLILQLLAGFGQFVLRFLGGQQALLVGFLLGSTFGILGQVRRLMHGIAGLLKRSERRVLTIGHGFAQLLGTARGFVRHALDGIRAALEALAQVVRGTVEMFRAFLLCGFLGLRILRLVEGFAQVVRRLANLLLHPLQVVLMTAADLPLQFIEGRRHLLMRHEGRALLLLPLGALRRIAIAGERGLGHQALLPSHLLRGLGREAGCALRREGTRGIFRQCRLAMGLSSETLHDIRILHTVLRRRLDLLQRILPQLGEAITDELGLLRIQRRGGGLRRFLQLLPHVIGLLAGAFEALLKTGQPRLGIVRGLLALLLILGHLLHLAGLLGQLTRFLGKSLRHLSQATLLGRESAFGRIQCLFKNDNPQRCGLGFLPFEIGGDQLHQDRVASFHLKRREQEQALHQRFLGRLARERGLGPLRSIHRLRQGHRSKADVVGGGPRHTHGFIGQQRQLCLTGLQDLHHGQQVWDGRDAPGGRVIIGEAGLRTLQFHRPRFRVRIGGESGLQMAGILDLHRGSLRMRGHVRVQQHTGFGDGLIRGQRHLHRAAFQHLHIAMVFGRDRGLAPDIGRGRQCLHKFRDPGSGTSRQQMPSADAITG